MCSTNIGVRPCACAPRDFRSQTEPVSQISGHLIVPVQDANRSGSLMSDRFQSFIRAFGANPTVRQLSFAALAVPMNLVVALWKILLSILTQSPLVLATGLFNASQAVSKTVAVRTHDLTESVVGGRRGGLSGWFRAGDPIVAFRLIGISTLVSSLLITVSSVWMLACGQRVTDFPPFIAVNLAVLNFVELGFAIRGILASRGDQMISAIKVTNLVGALMLLPLTQAVLLSLTTQGDHNVANAAMGVICGSVAFLAGWRMLRHRPGLDRPPADSTAD